MENVVLDNEDIEAIRWLVDAAVTKISEQGVVFTQPEEALEERFRAVKEKRQEIEAKKEKEENYVAEIKKKWN